MSGYTYGGYRSPSKPLATREDVLSAAKWYGRFTLYDLRKFDRRQVRVLVNRMADDGWIVVDLGARGGVGYKLADGVTS